MKKIFSTVALVMIMSTPVCAEVETTVAADVVSEYVWRGAKCGDAAIQPTLGVSVAGFDLSLWGSVGVANFLDTKELDITLSYSIAGASVGVTDYWFSTGDEPYGRYFKYGKGATNHVFEAFAGYDFGLHQSVGTQTLRVLITRPTAAAHSARTASLPLRSALVVQTGLQLWVWFPLRADCTVPKGLP